MKAVILAAGKGERLGKIEPKILVRLLGLPIIERAILSAREAGVKEFCIVTGYEGDQIRFALGNGEKFGVKIEHVENKDWKKGNGRSLLAAKEKLTDDNFLLLMGDHIFDPRILKGLMETEAEGSCVLCVDRNLEEVFDLEGATKVEIRDGLIKEIGKNLPEFNGVDCGIFLCTRNIFRALETSITNGSDEISDGVRALAAKGKVKAFDITGSLWQDVDTPAGLREAEQKLLRSLTKDDDGVISRFLNRRISARISKSLVDRAISPTQVSLLAFLIGISAALFFFTGKYALLAVGGLLAQLSSIVDGCDGEIARLKFLGSKSGAWIDSVLDRYADALLILGLTYYGWCLAGGPLIWLVGSLALIGGFAVSYTRARFEGAFHFSPSPRWSREIPARRDSRIFIIMLGALLNQVFYALLILVVLTHVEVLRRLVSWGRHAS